MTVHDVQIACAQPLQGSLHAVAHPFCGIVELAAGDAPDFCEDVVGFARVRGRAGVERGAEQGFGGAVVGRGVEGADAEVEGAADDGGGGDGGDGGVVLGVEGCGAADERGEGG